MELSYRNLATVYTLLTLLAACQCANLKTISLETLPGSGVPARGALEVETHNAGTGQKRAVYDDPLQQRKPSVEDERWSCPPVHGFTIHKGKDHTGADITQLLGWVVGSLKAACDAEPSCQAFTWKPDGTSGWLKSDGTITDQDAGEETCFYVRDQAPIPAALSSKAVQSKAGGLKKPDQDSSDGTATTARTDQLLKKPRKRESKEMRQLDWYALGMRHTHLVGAADSSENLWY